MACWILLALVVDVKRNGDICVGNIISAAVFELMIFVVFGLVDDDDSSSLADLFLVRSITWSDMSSGLPLVFFSVWLDWSFSCINSSAATAASVSSSTFSTICPLLDALVNTALRICCLTRLEVVCGCFIDDWLELDDPPGNNAGWPNGNGALCVRPNGRCTIRAACNAAVGRIGPPAVIE